MLIHPQFAHYGPQNNYSRAYNVNLEKSQDCVAEGGEFELAIALRIGSQPPCSASEKITDWVARFAL